MSLLSFTNQKEKRARREQVTVSYGVSWYSLTHALLSFLSEIEGQ